MTLIELIATIFGLLCVGLTIRQSIWCWPAGLVQVALYVCVFYEAKLYSDVLLHLVYVVLGIYGWYHWLRGGPREDGLPVTRLAAMPFAGWLLVAAMGAAGLGYLMSRWTDASLPYWDAAIAAMSLVAQYLLARKVLQNWLLWIAVDVVAIGVYGAKGLYITTGLYAVFLVMATMGWFAWKRSYQQMSIAVAAGLSSASSCPQPAGTSS